MGFGFLYGVFGSSIGSIVGALLYVRFIDNPMIAYVKTALVNAGSSIVLANNATIKQALTAAESIGLTKEVVATSAYPSTLWLIFSGIGVLCIIGLLLYQKFIGTREAQS